MLNSCMQLAGKRRNAEVCTHFSIPIALALESGCMLALCTARAYCHIELQCYESSARAQTPEMKNIYLNFWSWSCVGGALAKTDAISER